MNTDQRGMPDLNSMREVMQNPEFLRMFSSPETMQVDIIRILLYFDEFELSGWIMAS